MDIPYYILLILYVVGLVIFFVWSFFNMWHLFKFGMFDFTGKLNAFVFIGYALAVIAVTVLLIAQTPWLDSFDLFSIGDGLITPASSGNPSGSTI